MTAAKRAIVQSRMVTKMCVSLRPCFTIHKLSALHAWECDAEILDVNNIRVANTNRVKCLCSMTGQPDMLTFYVTGNVTSEFSVQETEDSQEQRRENVVRAIVSMV